MIGRFKDNLIIMEKGFNIDNLFANKYYLVEDKSVEFNKNGFLLKNKKIYPFEKGKFYLDEFEKALISEHVDKKKFLEDLLYDNQKFIFLGKINVDFKCKKFNTLYSSFKEAENYLKKFLDDGFEKEKIILVFNELFMNAYEHGNLDLSFEDKERLIREDKYCEFLKKGSDKKIEVCIAKKDEYLFVKITDEGRGFTLEEKEALFNGRGIKLCEKYVYLFYNQKGNSVLFIGKRHGL